MDTLFMNCAAKLQFAHISVSLVLNVHMHLTRLRKKREKKNILFDQSIFLSVRWLMPTSYDSATLLVMQQ